VATVLTVDELAFPDDHSGSFQQIRPSIHDPRGASYRELRAGLEPRWAVVWADLGATTAVAWGLPLLLATLERRRASRPLIALGGAAAVGAAVQRVGLFLHEGSHFNLAPTKPANEIVTNATAGAMVLADVRAYRPGHMEHHRSLGTVDDPERSYFEALDWRFIAKGLLGARVLAVLRLRTPDPSSAPSPASAPVPAPTGASRLVPLTGALLHATVVATALRKRRPATAFAWAAGVGSVYPLLGSLRQLLEHRDERASRSTDYATVDHGALSRMFTPSRWSWILGGAGFNRHLLHHWDAGISYTRLKDLEARLASTGVGPLIDSRRSSYTTTFVRLWKSSRSR
jgi:fatty acid desaturase